jgi:hypothetical protein
MYSLNLYFYKKIDSLYYITHSHQNTRKLTVKTINMVEQINAINNTYALTRHTFGPYFELEVKTMKHTNFIITNPKMRSPLGLKPVVSGTIVKSA